jgi:hypothetical protein
VVTHPADPNIVYVAAQGQLWGYNRERGCSRRRTAARRGGNSPADCRTTITTGAGDLMMDPANPQILYANMWERIRKPYTFESGGPNGGLYKTTNGGESWTKRAAGCRRVPSARSGSRCIARTQNPDRDR